MAEGYWVVCPLCGLNRKLHKTGGYAERYKKPLTKKKGETRFDRLSPESAPFIDIRETGGGRGTGFPRIGQLTLEEVKDNPLYSDLVKQIVEQSKKVLEILD